MRTYVFASRNIKEILRDIITLFFGLVFPLVILILLYAIGSGIPKESNMNMFDVEVLTPGITVFGLSFIALFSAQLIAKDKTTSFMMRLFTSPVKPHEFILGYTLPLIPISLVQTLICYIAAIMLGLEFTPNIFLAAVVNIPISLVFVALGLLCGTALSEKAVGGVCGALLTNLSAWFSNIWFDTALVGGWFERIANVMPFAHAVNAARYALIGSFEGITADLLWVIGYAVVLIVVAIIVFTVKIKKDK